MFDPNVFFYIGKNTVHIANGNLKEYEIFYLKCIESDLKHVCVQAYSGFYISKNTARIAHVASDGSLKIQEIFY